MRWIVVLLLTISITSLSQSKNEEIRKSIYFGGGSYDIDEFQAQELFLWLDSVPDLLNKYEIHLISHTDPIGGKEYNEWLSKMRSESVRQLLLNKSIPEHKISTKDWGLENPVYNNRSFGGMRMNRRVDVILYPLVL
ncbi:MAG: OmpA family protein [Flammeovirgaceae bacterium]|nr:OmpA family protein [Flammeovirgaceae bacterium]